MADIMKQGGNADAFNFIPRQPHFGGNAYGIVCYLLAVQIKFGAFQFDEEHEGADYSTDGFVSIDPAFCSLHKSQHIHNKLPFVK